MGLAPSPDKLQARQPFLGTFQQPLKQNGVMLLNHPVTSNTTKQIWRVRLVHAESGARVVEASCEEGGQPLAMALGEATTAEEAEDRARHRAEQMLLETSYTPASLLREEADQPETTPLPQSSPPSLSTSVGTPATSGATISPDRVSGQPAISQSPVAPGQQEPSPSQAGSEPSDWSEDLATVEVQLERLGWDRNQESVYLERCFGHMERSSITRYQDLRLYIDALQALSPSADPCTAPLPGQLQPPLPSREFLMQTNGKLLDQLGWTTKQGRDFLKGHFGHTSRQSLSDEQMMRFNQQLEALLTTDGGDRSALS